MSKRKGLDVVVCTPWEATAIRLVESFSEQGHRVRSVLSGKACLKTCKKHCPDLVVVDEALEDPSAVALIDELKSDVRTQGVHVVFLDRPHIGDN